MSSLHCSNRRSHLTRTRTPLIAASLAVLASSLPCLAADPPPSQKSPATNLVAKTEKPAPLPLHQFEGNGGVFSTLSAYLVNPPRNGEPVGRPSTGFIYVHLGSGRELESFTVTETPCSHVEFGYGYNHLDLGDLPSVLAAQGVQIANSVDVHNVNARVQFLKEGEYDMKWLPAITGGIHFKYNDGIEGINHSLNNGLAQLGIGNHEGLDFTLYGSKMLTCLPRPVLINLGGRATKGAQLGLLGFTDEYSFVFEGSVVVLVTDDFLLAAEYKQKPRDFASTSLVGPEDDWWTIDAGYVVNSHMTLAVGYGHFGTVVNHTANGVWGLAVKWEF